jgi:hypothetical protein
MARDWGERNTACTEVCKASHEVVSQHIQVPCVGECLAVPFPVPAFMLMAWIHARVVGGPADPHGTLGSFRGIPYIEAGEDADLGLTKARKSRFGDNHSL